jgi:uncharacterized membrane protein YdjX (TVP38/TMEM64 family)
VFGEFLTVLRARRQAAAMSTEILPPKKKLPIAKLALAGAVCAVIGAVVLYFIGWETAWNETKRIFAATLEFVAAAGPAVFFGAMALFPAFGAPMAPFAIAAGLVFRERLGLPLVLLLGVAAMSFNIAMTYWLARRWLRPWLSRLLDRWGYHMPQVDQGDATDLIVLLRTTPGPPFFVQNYLLGLADVPFGRYMLISCSIQGLFLCAFMVFGDALSQGRGKLVMLAAGAFVALVVGTHLVRKHLAKKKAAA